MHPRARHRLVHVEQVLALAEAVEERGHAADVERVGAEPQQVVQDPRDLVEHHADVLRALGHFDPEQPLDRKAVGVLVAHHRHVVEPVHVRQRLQVRLVLGQLFGRAVQKADVRVRARDDFAVELEHEPQHPVRRRVLGSEVHGVVTNFSHGLSDLSKSFTRAHNTPRANAKRLVEEFADLREQVRRSRALAARWRTPKFIV